MHNAAGTLHNPVAFTSWAGKHSASSRASQATYCHFTKLALHMTVIILGITCQRHHKDDGSSHQQLPAQIWISYSIWMQSHVTVEPLQATFNSTFNYTSPTFQLLFRRSLIGAFHQNLTATTFGFTLPCAL